MKEYGRYLIGVIAAIFTVIILVLAFNFVRGIFTGGSKEDKPKDNVNQAFDLDKAAQEGKAVRYTVKGIVDAREDRREIRITVRPDSREVEVINGYDGSVLKSQRFDNTQNSYKTFVDAINGSGFTSVEKTDPKEVETQSCPLGFRYNYEVNPGQSGSFYTWSTSCGKLGPFIGDGDTIQALFEEQIPNYTEFIADVNLD